MNTLSEMNFITIQCQSYPLTETLRYEVVNGEKVSGAYHAANDPSDFTHWSGSLPG